MAREVLRPIWDAYNLVTNDPTAPPIPRDEQQRLAFYAGALTCYRVVLAAAEHPDEGEVERRLEELQAEALAVLNAHPTGDLARELAAGFTKGGGRARHES